MDIYKTITKQNPSWGITGVCWFFVLLSCFSRIIKQSYKSNRISFSQSLAYVAIYIYIWTVLETSVYKGYKQDKIEMRGDRAEMSDFPLYLNTVAGGLDCRDQTIGGFSFVVKIYAVPVVEIIG